MSALCTDCGQTLAYEDEITPLCDDCLDLTCPAPDCESGAQVMVGRHPNGAPRYECRECSTEWSNTTSPAAVQ